MQQCSQALLEASASSQTSKPPDGQVLDKTLGVNINKKLGVEAGPTVYCGGPDNHRFSGPTFLIMPHYPIRLEMILAIIQAFILGADISTRHAFGGLRSQG